MKGPEVFVDTNVLVYAYDSSDDSKHQAAKQIMEECFSGERMLAFSTQVLGEFFSVITKKSKKTPLEQQVHEILETIIGFHLMPVFVIQPAQVLLASQTSKTTGISYWDCLIAETMKANGVYTILTENTRDFGKISGINAINPFKPNTEQQNKHSKLQQEK